MVSMQLVKYDKLYMLGIDKQETERVVAAANAGEKLVYESADGCITIEKGVMHLSGFQEVPQLFGAIGDDGAYDWRASFTKPLKALVKKVVVAEGVAELVTTFRNFPNLREILLPSTMERLYNAFEGCNKLKFPSLPAGLRVFHTTMSWTWHSMEQEFTAWPEEIILPAGMEDIGQTFAYAPIRSIVLPASLKVIDTYAFYRCEKLEQVTLTEGVEEIGKEAFGRCTALRSVAFPASLTEIGSYAFSDCAALTDVSFAGDPVIYKYAFRNSPCEEQILLREFGNTATVPYTAEMGEIAHLDLLMKTLADKPFSAQADHFFVSTDMSITRYAYGDEEGTEQRELGKPLALCMDVEKLIVLDGVIVGVVIDDVPVIEGKTTCTYSASEDDGAGSRSREDYATLIFKEEISK